VRSVEAWAGPREAELLGVNVRALRADLATVKRVQNQHGVLLGTLTEDVSRLKGDVAVLKTDVAELKLDVAELIVAVREILRRLPPAD
jgi:hypothetical protein